VQVEMVTLSKHLGQIFEMLPKITAISFWSILAKYYHKRTIAIYSAKIILPWIFENPILWRTSI